MSNIESAIEAIQNELVNDLQSTDGKIHREIIEKLGHGVEPADVINFILCERQSISKDRKTIFRSLVESKARLFGQYDKIFYESLGLINSITDEIISKNLESYMRAREDKLQNIRILIKKYLSGSVISIIC